MTHLWTDGLPVHVETDDLGAPRQFVWRGETHQIQGVANTWRIEDEWWRKRICRDYYKVYTLTGLLVILYQDILAGQWFLERLYD